MTVLCNCTDCGGTEEALICEAKLFDTQEQVWAHQQRFDRSLTWIVVGAVLAVIAAGALPVLLAYWGGHL